MLVQHRRPAAHGGVEVGDLGAHTIAFTGLRLPGRQAVEPDPVRHGLPPKVEERVNRLYLNPPASAFECLPYQLGVVARRDDVLVAVLHIGVLERNLGLLLVLIDRVAIEICRWLL